MNNLNKINVIDKQKDLKLNELLPVFLSEMDISKASKKIYQAALNNFFAFLKTKGLTFPSRADIIDYKNEICQVQTAKTVNLKLSVIRSFFTWTQFNRIYPNIAYGIKGARIERSPKRNDLSSAQIRGILENINTGDLCGRQKYALVLLASTTGLRAAEISGLDVSDLQIVKDTTILKVKGKGFSDKGQVVKIGPKTEGAIRSALAMRDPLSPGEPLFISTSNFSYGSRISSKGISKILKKILKDNNFNGSFYTGHSFRHSACCLGLEVTGQDLLEVKKFMRHQNLETTMIYADHSDFMANNIAEEIEKKLL